MKLNRENHWRCTFHTQTFDHFKKKWRNRIAHDIHGNTFKELKEKAAKFHYGVALDGKRIELARDAWHFVKGKAAK